MNFEFNFDKKTGKIKEMHGVGQPPFWGPGDDLFHYLAEAGIPYSRLHDVGGNYGGNVYVDIHNIFRNFDADVNDEASYDFAFTDWLLARLNEEGVEPIYRLGETIENYHFLKAYRILPPKDPKKWAEICEHIILHYNYGWANGFKYGIKYWEIWNEPDNGRDDTENQMWHGTPEEFYELYTVAAKHLKAVFGDEIKVGGYATCGFRHIHSDPERYGGNWEKSDDTCYSSARSRNFIDFFEGFMQHIKREGAPLDFFSWHSYLSTERTVVCAEYLDRRLKEYGYGDVETQLNEWNNVCEDRGSFDESYAKAKLERGTGIAAAKTLSMMCAMQDTKTKILCYYDAGVDSSAYRGMFNPITSKPSPLYYAFPAFNELYKLGNQVECTKGKDGIYTLAAADGDKRAALIVNATYEERTVTTNLPSDMKAYLVDDVAKLDLKQIDTACITLAPGSFLLFKD